MTKDRKTPKRRYRRRPGAYDRFMSNQVDSEGKKVLQQKPMDFEEQLIQDQEITRELSGRFMHRQQMYNRAQQKRNRQMLIQQQKEQLLAKAQPELYDNYQDLLEEGIDSGMLIN